MKIRALILIFLVSTGLGAEDYTIISSLGLSTSKTNGVLFTTATITEIDATALGFTRYFGGKPSLGPLNEFDYINRTSNISVSHIRTNETNTFMWGSGSSLTFNEDENLTLLGGEAFFDRAMVGVGFSRASNTDSDSKTFSLGLLPNENILVRLDVIEPGEDWSSNHLTIKGNFDHNSTNYFGFTLEYNNDVELRGLSGRYFSALGGDTYFALDVEYLDFLNIHALDIGGSYYFSRTTSVSVLLVQNDLDSSTNSDTLYRLGFSHFFNKNIALEVSYGTSNADYSEYKGQAISLIGQF